MCTRKRDLQRLSKLWSQAKPLKPSTITTRLGAAGGQQYELENSRLWGKITDLTVWINNAVSHPPVDPEFRLTLAA